MPPPGTHARGAFSGANHGRPGLFEAAGGGTLLLDEVGEVSPGMQVKLLRAIQEREIRRVGENKSRPVDVRLLAATNRDVAQRVAEGLFPQDLYYRPKVVELHVPPLRKCRAAMRPLAEVEKKYILPSLQLNGGNQTRTAKQLEIGSVTLYRKLKRCGLLRPKALVHGAHRQSDRTWRALTNASAWAAAVCSSSSS